MGEAHSPAPVTPEQGATVKRWVDAWAGAAERMESLRRDEIRNLDTFATIALLCGPADYHQPPFAPQPDSGLVEQQRWFARIATKS
ncbi:MAG: hypothetical protein RIS76_1509 [Verrucomicrobiota bacterium]|jgi:hypothetical protein